MASEGFSASGFKFKLNKNLPFIKFRSSEEINKSAGRAFLDNGDIFYSPNCARDVEVPKPWDHKHSAFDTSTAPRGLWDLDPSVFEKPAWWTSLFGWLAFLELSDSRLDCALFSGLKSRRVHRTQDEPSKYSLYLSDMNAWLRIDKQLTAAALLISMHNGLISMCPVSPWQFGYLHEHPTHGALKVCLDKSLKWFPIVVARLSYIIAAAETRHSQFESWSSLARLHWMEVLLAAGAEVGIDKTWIDMLCDTTVTDYGPFVERTGLFLDPLDNDEYQPAVSWYCHHNIPVWYPWGKKQATSKELMALAPLPEQLQHVTTFLSKEPSVESSLDPCGVGISQSPGYGGETERTEAEKLEACRKRIDEFFEDQKLRNDAILASETPEAYKRRLARENQPSRTKARMFFWRISACGDVEREFVPVSERDDMFNIYGIEQIRYNSVQDEWDVCELWGDLPDVDNSSDWAYGGDDRRPEEISNPFPDNRSCVLENDQYMFPRLACSACSLLDRFEAEILDVLCLYFGYTPAIPLLSPSPLPVTNESLRKNICRSLGFSWDSVKSMQTVFERPSVVAALDFFLRLADGKSKMSGDEWDLCRDNRSPVSFTARFKQFRCVVSTDGTPLYLLDLKEDKKAVWYLALKKACDVSVVCRLAANKSEYDIVEFLLRNGIPFHTLMQRSALRKNPTSCNRIPDPPIRPSAYVFDADDYLSYRERCVHFLKRPRGRAALMHGQLPWRLAVSVVPWETVYKGPSGWYEDDKGMIVVKDLVTGLELVDDHLTEAEDLALCGTYHCMTGMKNQVAICSWYMPLAMWDGSTQDHRRWTEYAEKVFSLLDNTYAFSPGSKNLPPVFRQPYNKQTWRNHSRGSLSLRKALSRIETTTHEQLSS